jgi:toxin ParE1/3/4
LTTRYVLTAAAETDVREIVRHTRRQWGEAQARGYLTKLGRGIERLVAGQGVFKEMSVLHPGLRMVHCEHHYIFCLPRNDAPALVVAIFHERMDLMVRLAERLK